MSTSPDLHILILSSWYPTLDHPFLGNFVQRQATILSEKYKVTVVHTVPLDDQKEIEISQKTNHNLTEVYAKHPKGSHVFSRRKQRLKALDLALKQIEKPDLIHGQIILPNGYLFVAAKDYFGCPLIVTEHGSYYRPGRKNKLSLKEKYVLQLIKKYADRLIAVSSFLNEDMASIFGDKKISVIGNPVNTELFRPNSQKHISNAHFIHVSTLDPQIKNVPGILEAMSLLVQKGYEEVRLTIVSDENYEHIADKVSSMGLNRYVNFAGPLSSEELLDYYQKSTALVMFSHYETFSIVIAEAWASGIPVISTPVGIAAEMSEEAGILVKDNDPLSLAMAMEKIINDLPFDPLTIRKEALNYTEEVFLHSISEIYYAALQN